MEEGTVVNLASVGCGKSLNGQSTEIAETEVPLEFPNHVMARLNMKRLNAFTYERIVSRRKIEANKLKILSLVK